MSVGENLKKLRTEKGLTQEELAKKVNVNRSMIAQIERGTKQLTIALGSQIAIELGCSINEFSEN